MVVSDTGFREKLTRKYLGIQRRLGSCCGVEKVGQSSWKGISWKSRWMLLPVGAACSKLLSKPNLIS